MPSQEGVKREPFAINGSFGTRKYEKIRRLTRFVRDLIIRFVQMRGVYILSSVR